MKKYVLIGLSDEKGFSGLSFNFGLGKTAAAERSAMSEYGSEIPIPTIAFLIPVCDWKKRYQELFACKTSGRTTSGISYRMTAKLRDSGILEELRDKYKIIWSGYSTEIPDTYKKPNKGAGFEILQTGTYNKSDSTFDGMIRLQIGAVNQRVLVQVKYMGLTFHKTDYNTEKTHISRGARGGYTTANWTEFDDSDET